MTKVLYQEVSKQQTITTKIRISEKIFFPSKSPTRFCHKLSSPSQAPNVDSNSSVEFQESATESNSRKGETEDTFETWISSMGKEAYAQHQAMENKQKVHRLLDKLYLATKRQANKELIQTYIRKIQDNAYAWFRSDDARCLLEYLGMLTWRKG